MCREVRKGRVPIRGVRASQTSNTVRNMNRFTDVSMTATSAILK